MSTVLAFYNMTIVYKIYICQYNIFPFKVNGFYFGLFCVFLFHNVLLSTK